jgi:hypothetical protein
MLQTYVYPVFKNTPVAAIGDALVLKGLQPIGKEKTKTASRIPDRTRDPNVNSKRKVQRQQWSLRVLD